IRQYLPCLYITSENQANARLPAEKIRRVEFLVKNSEKLTQGSVTASVVDANKFKWEHLAIFS
ncbi:MAG: hypothetical protein LBP21_05065, partial [Synergistaceae bacterium]|nr:hypothetical protein [Synergistaceae bacterium]